MSDQRAVGPSLDDLPKRSSPTRIPARRRVWRFIGQFRGGHQRSNSSSDIVAGATPPTSSPRLRRAGRKREVGTIVYLVCLALVAAATVGVFFGVGLYSLGHRPGAISSDAGADHAHELLSSGDRAASPHAETPATVSAAPAASTAMTASTASGAQAARPDATGTQPGQMVQPGAAAQTPGVSAEPGGEPIAGRGDRHSEPKRFAMASTEIVSGTVTQVSDATTWVVGDKTVHLWGIRPASLNSPAPLEEVVDWVRSKGPVECRKQAHSRRYRCATSAGEDIAQAALLAGIGRTVRGATVAYRNAEAQGRQRSKVR
jgi:hypothetical protein